MRPMRCRRWALVALALAILLLGTALPARAATPQGDLSQITPDGNTLRFLFGATDVPPGASLDRESLQVRLNGQPLARTILTAGTSAQQQVARTVMLVIDTSGSMRGSGIRNAQRAALKFIAEVPADVRIGLISFSDAPLIRLPPDMDRAKVRRAVQALTAEGNTALYDAVSLALKTLGTSGVRLVVLLSDGESNRGRSRLADVIGAVRASKAIVYALGTNQAPNHALHQIADASGIGRALSAATSKLSTVFGAFGRDFASHVLVTARVPEAMLGKQATVAVTAKVGGIPVAASASVTLAGRPAHAQPAPIATGPLPVRITPGPLSSPTVLLVALCLVFVGLVALLLGWGRVRAGEVGVRRRLSLYTLTGRAAEDRARQATVLGDSALARSAVQLAGRMVSPPRVEAGIARRLDAAGLPLRPPEWALIHVGAAVLAGLLFFAVSRGSLLGLLVGVLIGAAAPFGYLVLKETRRLNAFLAQLPDTLQLLAGSLKAGYSFPQAMDVVAREGTQPIAGELSKTLSDARLGMAIEDGLEAVAARMKSQDFAWVVMAIRIQREVGGNLAEVLETVAGTLRERERLRRQVRVLSAEGRLSAVILFLLPIVFAVYLALARPQYLGTLFTDPLGIAMVVVMLGLLAVGAMWLRIIVRVEV